MSTSLLISSFSPFPNTLSLSLPSQTPLCDLRDILADEYPEIPFSSLGLSHPNCQLVLDNQPLSSLHDSDSPTALVTLRLHPRVRGGKGGFGSQLRAAGGRMSSQKTSNNDSCRDLNGRRISTVKEARKVAEYLEAEPQRKKAAAEAQKAKLEALERKLGIDPNNASSSAEPAKLAGMKHRFDDTEYLEQSRDIVDGVKSAVAAGLLKKRKKAKKEALEKKEAPDADESAEPVQPSTTSGPQLMDPETPVVAPAHVVAGAVAASA